jgi:hypothetical protein
MNWTNDKPTSPGYYWARRDESDRYVIVEIDAEGVVSMCGIGEDANARYAGGQFAGPIPEPG